MPLRAEKCYFSAIEVGEGDYLAYMLDPEERFPVELKTSLAVNLVKPWTAYDAVTGSELQAHGNAVDVEIPAGGYRLVRVVEQK